MCFSALQDSEQQTWVSVQKKTLHAAEQNREDIKAKREAWKASQPAMDAGKLVFLDESSINTGMTRLYGRGVGGKRVDDYAPNIRFERTSILSSVRLSGELVPLVFEGSLNGEFFREYASKFLVPTLQKGDVVIMDNLAAYSALH